MPSNIWDLHSQILQKLLKNLRKEAGLTQFELATLLNKPQSYVSKYESGEKRLDLIELKVITEYCDSSLENFVKDFEVKILS